MSALVPVRRWRRQDGRAGGHDRAKPTAQSSVGRKSSCCQQHSEAWSGWPGQWCRAGPPGCCTNPLPISQLHLADFTSQFLSDHLPEDTLRATPA